MAHFAAGSSQDTEMTFSAMENAEFALGADAWKPKSPCSGWWVSYNSSKGLGGVRDCSR